MDRPPSSHLKQNSAKRFQPTTTARPVPIRSPPPVQRGCILGKHRIQRSSTPCTWRKAGHILRALAPKTLTNHDAATFCCLLPLRCSYFLHLRVLYPESNDAVSGLQPDCRITRKQVHSRVLCACAFMKDHQCKVVSLQHLIYIAADV